MKVCPVCKSAVPDDAEYCDTCGNDEFFDGGYPQQFEQPYQDGYSQPQYDYNQQYQQPQPQYNYNQQYQQPQPQYNYNQQYQQPQPQYDYNQQYQQPQPQYDYNQQYQQPQPQYDYNQQYQQPQPQYDYNQQYQQPQQPQYNYNQQYQQPQQPQYDYDQQQPQYQEQQEQPPAEVQQTVTEEPVYEEVQPAEETQPAEEAQPAEEVQTVEEAQPAEPEEPKENPYEVSKNFVFEKKETAEQVQPETKEKPKNLKGYIEMFMNTKDHTIEFDKGDIAKNSKDAMIASLGITFWIPFIKKDYSRYARYYGNQGLLTLILMIPCTIFYCLITGVVICNACTAAVYQNGVAAFRYLTFGGWIAAIIFFAICYAIPIFIIYCSITNIKQGKAKDIPLIGALRLIS